MYAAMSIRPPTLERPGQSERVRETDIGPRWRHHLMERSIIQRGQTVNVPGIDVSPLGKQHLDHLQFSIVGDKHQRGYSANAPGVDVSSLCNEGLDRSHIACIC